MISRLPTRSARETRITWRAAVASLGGGRRSVLRVVAFSLAPNAPRSAPSMRSGTEAKVVSPSSAVKTAPPIRAAPHKPVRMVPLNHCTDTRRRSIKVASVPLTDSGGSWPRSIDPGCHAPVVAPAVRPVAQTRSPETPAPQQRPGPSRQAERHQLNFLAQQAKRLRNSRNAGVENHHQCYATPPDALRRNGKGRSAITTSSGSPPSWMPRRRDGLAIHETLHILNPERRNIVAQVRREAGGKLGLSCNRRRVHSAVRCDNLLTIGVDNKRRLGL